MLLDIKGLSVTVQSGGKRLHAIRDLTLSVSSGETLALVGESGCGKSLTALAIMGLLPKPAVQVAGGSIVFETRNLTELRERDFRCVRGRDIGMIFQEPMTSLNPILTIGEQLSEALFSHQDMTRAELGRRCVELLDSVRIPNARERLRQFPHELSGGMRQRVMIAMAIANGPKLLIADEPTTALDVTIQRQILELLAELRRSMNLALLIITHDLGVVAEIADRVAVMYAGRKVEEADVYGLFETSRHPYTQGLLRASPKVALTSSPEPLADIPGRVPSLREIPPGCPFVDRCTIALEHCRAEWPASRLVAETQTVACHAVS
jgi:oligopeptide/dipeptide ABC transporter ATP-binding protein